jgi:hypothetical protein
LSRHWNQAGESLDRNSGAPEFIGPAWVLHLAPNALHPCPQMRPKSIAQGAKTKASKGAYRISL